MGEARRALGFWIGGRDGGITRAQNEGGTESWTTPPVDLGDPEPDEAARREAIRAALDALPEPEEPKPPREFPPDQQRLGDRRPEFKELSERTAEANQRSSGRWPR